MKNYLISNFLNSEGRLICPICGKKFKPNDDTKYVIGGGFPCSWKCFWIELKRRNDKKDNENKRG